MTIGAIDPYDIAIRVDLGEIREEDLPKVFSGDTKALAECKRHIYKLRSDKLLYQQMALVDLLKKLQFATSPEMISQAIGQSVSSVEDEIKVGISTIYNTKKDRARSVIIADTDKAQGAILEIVNAANGSKIIPQTEGNNIVSKKTFDKVVETVKKINKINENVLGTAIRRKAEVDILKNETIPFMSRMWAIGVIGDVLEMLGKALGGNL